MRRSTSSHFSRWSAPLALVALLGLGAARPAPGVERNPRWATPVRIDGLPNLYRVSDELYRAAQVTERGVDALASEPLSIRTVVSLRFQRDDEKLLPPGALTRRGIHYDRIPMTPTHPEDEDVLRFLSIVATAPKPVLVHCQRGADRTGLMCAVYRIVVQGWSKEEALAELLGGDFGANRFLFGFSKRYLEKLDVRSIRLRAGLKSDQ